MLSWMVLDEQIQLAILLAVTVLIVGGCVYRGSEPREGRSDRLEAEISLVIEELQEVIEQAVGPHEIIGRSISINSCDPHDAYSASVRLVFRSK